MSINNIKNLILSFLFSTLILIASLFILKNVEVVNFNPIVIISFLINFVLIIGELIKPTKNGYSLREIVLSFMFIFMFFSPLVQYISNIYPWWDTNLITDELIVYCNFIITLFLLVFNFVYHRTTYKMKIKIDDEPIVIKNIPFLIDLLFLLTIMCSLVIIGNTGIINLFSRSTNSLNINSSSLTLIIQNTFRAVPVFYVALNILVIRNIRKKYKILPFIVGLLLMILVNFPTGTARYWTATVYIGLIILLFKKFRNPHIFKILIFIGLFVVFPIINIFRNNTFSEVLKLNIVIPNPTEAFLSGDYDSYSMLLRAIIHSDMYGLTFGHQLLGSLLFFIPRFIWPSKPIGSGSMVARNFGWQFTNVSMPFIGEGYINFGIIGVVLFSIFLAYFTSQFDFSYHNQIDKKSITSIKLIYPFTLGFLFFILRGDLLSSYSYYVGFMIPIFIIMIFNKFKI